MSSNLHFPEKEVPGDLGGHPLDAVLRALFDLTWGRARELAKRGKITVNGAVATDPRTRIRKGSTIAIHLAAKDPRALAVALPENALVYLDPHVVVVDKPSGISTVPFDPNGMGASIAKRARPGEDTTLDERVRIAVAKRLKLKGPPPALGVVHRLDKETSGLLVFTRTWAAKKSLLQAFRLHAVHRRYLALVHGRPRDKTITTHFVEDRGDGRRGSVEKRGGRTHAIAREPTQRAITHIQLVEEFEGASLVACRLETGRTHQIRIHLAEEGYPVLGERVYARRGTAEIPAPRVMLHAAELGFTHPATDEEMRWDAELPRDFREMLAFLRRGAAPP